MDARTGAVAVGGGLGDGAGQRTTAHLGGKPAELLLVLHKLDLLEREKDLQFKMNTFQMKTERSYESF